MTNTASTSLRNHFLVAMPGMEDPRFVETVTLICEHDAEGAMGVVINRPTDLILGDVLGELELDPACRDVAARQVVLGGPVATDRGFVVHGLTGEFESTLAISPTLRISFSRDIVESVAALDEPQPLLFGIGYAGWGSGQLEDELLSNAWLTAPANREILFDLPFTERWQAAARLIGVDLARLAPDAGHD